MQSIQQKIDTVGNNVANINTNGYKSRDVFFQDILSARLIQPKEFELDGRLTPLGVDEGAGSRVALTLADFGQGQVVDTGISTDFMLTGENVFFTVANQDQETHFTRDGHFNIDAEGYLVTNQGDYVLNTDKTAIQVPEGYSLKVESTGKLLAENGQGQTIDLGSLQLVKVNSPQNFEEVGTNLYRIPTELAAQTNVIIENIDMLNPNNQIDYSVQQGKLEGSNVDLAKEMVQLTEAQRAYQFQARALSYSEQMLGMATRLRG